MKIALDTNTYTDLAKGEARVTALVARADSVALPFVVANEEPGLRSC